MVELVFTTILLQLIITFAHSQESPVLPRSFSFYSLNVLAYNGSSLNGNCSDITYNPNGTSTCNTPSSSVLFDGHIPTLTGLDGDTWANEFMILHYVRTISITSILDISFDFPRNTSRAEVTVFNCPQWDTGIYSITIYYSLRSTLRFYPTVVSCDSLVKMCVEIDTSLGFVERIFFYNYGTLVHIAEFAFYENNSSCPYTTIIPGSQIISSHRINLTTAEKFSTTSLKLSTTSSAITTTGKFHPSENEDSSLIIPLFAVLAAIMTFQTTVILIVLLVVTCRISRRKTNPSCDTCTNLESQLYETVNLEQTEVTTCGKSRINAEKNDAYNISQIN